MLPTKYLYIVSCMALFMTILTDLSAQKPEKNPFEIKDRLEQTRPKELHQDSTAVNLSESKPPDRWSNMERNGFSRVSSIFLLVFLGIIVGIKRQTIQSLFRTLVNLNYLNLLQRDQHFRYNIQNLLLIFLFVLATAFFAQQVLDYKFELIISWWKLAALIAIAYLLRHWMMQFISYVFDNNLSLQQFAYTIFVFNLILAVLLTPINILITFAPVGIAKLALYSGILLFIVLYIYRLYRGFLLLGRQIVANKLKFFTYLCTLEIAPILLIIKILQRLGVS